VFHVVEQFAEMACRSAKKILNLWFHGRIVFCQEDLWWQLPKWCMQQHNFAETITKKRYMHHFGANHKAGARAPGFFVRVRFLGMPDP